MGKWLEGKILSFKGKFGFAQVAGKEEKIFFARGIAQNGNIKPAQLVQGRKVKVKTRILGDGRHAVAHMRLPDE